MLYSKNLHKNISSLKLVENNNIQCQQEKQYSYKKNVSYAIKYKPVILNEVCGLQTRGKMQTVDSRHISYYFH